MPHSLFWSRETELRWRNFSCHKSFPFRMGLRRFSGGKTFEKFINPGQANWNAAAIFKYLSWTFSSTSPRALFLPLLCFCFSLPFFFLLAKLWVASERNGEKKSMQSLPHYVHATPSPPRLCAAVILGRGKLFPGCCWKIKKNFDARLARFKCFASLSAFPHHNSPPPPPTHTLTQTNTHIGRTEKIAKTHTFVHR